MLDEAQMQWLANSLVEAVRMEIPYSPNLPAQYSNSELRNIILERIRKRKLFIDLRDHEQNSKRTLLLEEKASLCDELFFLMAILIEISRVQNADNTFFSKVRLPGHSFGILHNSDGLKTENLENLVNVKLADDMKSFCLTFPDDTAVICDPWIWYAGPIWDYDAWISRIREIGVERFYTLVEPWGFTLDCTIPLRWGNTVPHLVGRRHQTQEKLEKYQRIFGKLQRRFLRLYEKYQLSKLVGPYCPTRSSITEILITSLARVNGTGKVLVDPSIFYSEDEYIF